MFGRWGLKIEVRYKGKVVMKGRKSTINGLWYVLITKSPVRITLDRPIRVRLIPTNKAKRLPPKPPNIKLDFEPPIRRNSVQLRIRNPQESTK